MQNLSCENEFYSHENNITGFAHSLALKQRLGATQKWPYASWPGFEFHFDHV